MIRSNSSADGDGPPLTYADSEVGSSPRSVGAGVSRNASLTEEPPKWDDIKVKLMCSYGGRILPRPHDNQLRYVGGESRIVVVNRNVSFVELKAKLSKMFGANMVVKYQLPYEDLDALISVTSDEDLENMMEEYDRLQSTSNRASSVRLRLFLFPLKLERSQTSSMVEMIDNSRGSEHLFVDILNSMPALPRVRSEASSVLSENPDYLAVQGNVDALEEWAAATSYGNSSLPPQAGPPEFKQPNAIPAALFGSLLQNPGSGDSMSAPGSPSPMKQVPFTTDSSSSAPPAVVSLLSAVVEAAASKGQPTVTEQVVIHTDPSLAALSIRNSLGSDDTTGSLPEEKKHVDSEILLTSNKGMLNSSLGGAEQLLLPAGLMDDDDVAQKSSAKSSFDEMNLKTQNLISEAVVAAGMLKSDVQAMMGQPVFDEEVLPEHRLMQNLKMLHLEEKAPSPITSPSGISSPSAQVLAPSAALQRQVPVVVTSKHQVVPLSPRAVAQSSGEDRYMQQGLPASAHMAASKLGGEDGYSPSLSHFLAPLDSPQEATLVAPSARLPGNETQIRGITASPKDVVGPETLLHVQPPTLTGGLPAAIPMLSSPFHPPIIRKVAAAPVSNYLYQQQMPHHSPEAATSATSYPAQAPPGIQYPVMSQTPSTLTSGATAPSSQSLTVTPGPNVAAPPRSGPVISHPQSPQLVPPGGVVFQPHLQHVRTTAPPVIPSAVGEVANVISPIVSNATATTIVSSFGEGVKGMPSSPYQQAETAQLPRQVNDPYGQRVMSPQLGSQYVAANLGVQPASGLPSRFKAVGHPIQQVAEGIPLQQSPMLAMAADKKGALPVQRAIPTASARPALMPDIQAGYYMVEQPNALAHPTLLASAPQFNAPSSIIPGAAVTSDDMVALIGVNPFAENFQPVPTYQDARGVAPPDQQQRRQMWS